MFVFVLFNLRSPLVRSGETREVHPFGGSIGRGEPFPDRNRREKCGKSEFPLAQTGVLY